MAQIITKFIKDGAVLSGSIASHGKIGSGAATASQALFADGSAGTSFRSISGSDISGGTFGAVNGSALTNLSAAALGGVLPVGVTGGSGLSIATSQLTGDISLTSQVSGVLPIANGGTGQATASAAFNALSPITATGDLIVGNGVDSATNLPIGTSGYVLTVVGGTAAWAPVGTASLTQNHVFVGNASNVATDVAMSGEASIVASGAVTLSNAAVIAKVLTGYTSGAGTISASDSILSAIEKLNGNQALYLPLAGGTMSGDIDMGGGRIHNVSDPSSAGDVATKNYVDSLVNGLSWKGPVKAYANSNIPLTGSTPLVIDGYTVLDGDLLLLAGQTTSADDGEYSVAITGGSYVLTANGQPSAIGDAWLVLNGTVFANSAFVATSAVPTAAFTEFAGPTAYSFTAPLMLSGNTVSITLASGSSNGYLSLTDWNTFNNKQAAGNYITALTGDVTASGPGSAAASLVATSNATLTTLSALTTASALASVGTITSGTWAGTTIAIAHGGTGQVTAAAAFAALSPLTTAGDLIYENATPAPARLPIGSNGNILTVVSGLPAWAPAASTLTVNEENPTLVSGDITNQYFDLAHAVQGSSATVNSISLNVVGGPEQLKGTDYTVSLTGGAGGVTRITFAGDLATGGNAALVSGDILQIKYAY